MVFSSKITPFRKILLSFEALSMVAVIFTIFLNHLQAPSFSPFLPETVTGLKGWRFQLFR